MTCITGMSVALGFRLLYVQRRREAEKQRSNNTGLDETAKELLEQNREERDKMEDEIKELRHRSVSINNLREFAYVLLYNAHN